MAGLEVVAAVAGIVSAYSASASLYYAWRNKRHARKKNTQNQGLEISLTTGKTAVQREYDEHFARLGKRFAVGDDRARAELLGYVVRLQHTMMTSMAADAGRDYDVLIPNLGLLMATSEDTRRDAVGSLAELYQRMQQAGPISRFFQNFSRRTYADSDNPSSALVQNSLTSPLQKLSYRTIERLKRNKHSHVPVNSVSKELVDPYCPFQDLRITEIGYDYQGKCPCGLTIYWPRSYQGKSEFIKSFGSRFETFLSQYHLAKQSISFYCLSCLETEGYRILFDDRQQLVHHYLGHHRSDQIVHLRH